ncbi:uncharacterized protein LOC107871651 [Capsicum annuum]|uniref:uncharacterized protein LOC107871651 n=1 Tax=Capsicum annuum TaxID=4072 RepID=UPI0007BEE77E|nr:uncharacterized protein LOC107871651 [Capsicum annuum]
MENFLRSKEYYPIVEDDIGILAEGETLTNAQKAELEARKLKDLKAKNYLFQAIDRPILETILCKETSKDIWDSMKKKYQGIARVKRAQLQALRRDFETLQMEEGELVLSYCTRTMEINNKMRFHGEKMDDVAIVEKILRSLTSKYNYVEHALKASTDTYSTTIEEEVEVEAEAEKEKEEEEIVEAEISAEISKPILINLKVEVETMTNPR